MDHIQGNSKAPIDVKEFKEFNRKDRDKIAEHVETRQSELLLSPIVEDYVYGTTRALDFGDYYGTLDKKAVWEHAVNKNADYFDVTELEKHNAEGIPAHLSFRKAAMYRDHQSDSLENSIGFVFDSYLSKHKYSDLHVVTLFGIDKKKSPAIARTLQTHPERVPVSMGCSIKSSECTICGKEIKRDPDLCEHLKYARGSRQQGKKVAEILKGIDFYELSVVNTPACPTAYVIDTIAEILPGRLLKIAADADESTAKTQIIVTLHRMIRDATTTQERVRLARSLDKVIYSLEQLI